MALHNKGQVHSPCTVVQTEDDNTILTALPTVIILCQLVADLTSLNQDFTALNVNR
jgi:hypothetical protein